MPEGVIRKFSSPMHLAAASSPLRIIGEDPIRADRKPLTRSVLRGDKYVLNVERCKGIDFFCRGVNLPGLSLGQVLVPTQLVDVNVPGDKLIFNPFIVRMAVAEDLSNYLEIQRWMRGIGKPETHAENRALTANREIGFPMGGETSDASLSIMTNAGGFEMFRVHFKAAFPINLEDLEFSPDGATDEITTTVTFLYTTYSIELIPEGKPA